MITLAECQCARKCKEKKTNKQKNPRLEALIFVSYCFLDSEVPRMSPTFHFSNFVFTKKNPLILWISLKKINKNQGARQKAVSLKDICPIVPICHALSLRKLQVDILHWSIDVLQGYLMYYKKKKNTKHKV